MLGTVFEMRGVTGKLFLEPSVFLLVSEKCLTVAYVTIFLYFKEGEEKIIQMGGRRSCEQKPHGSMPIYSVFFSQ